MDGQRSDDAPPKADAKKSPGKVVKVQLKTVKVKVTKVTATGGSSTASGSASPPQLALSSPVASASPTALALSSPVAQDPPKLTLEQLEKFVSAFHNMLVPDHAQLYSFTEDGKRKLSPRYTNVSDKDLVVKLCVAKLGTKFQLGLPSAYFVAKCSGGGQGRIQADYIQLQKFDDGEWGEIVLYYLPSDGTVASIEEAKTYFKGYVPEDNKVAYLNKLPKLTYWFLG